MREAPAAMCATNQAMAPYVHRCGRKSRRIRAHILLFTPKHHAYLQNCTTKGDAMRGASRRLYVAPNPKRPVY